MESLGCERNGLAHRVIHELHSLRVPDPSRFLSDAAFSVDIDASVVLQSFFLIFHDGNVYHRLTFVLDVQIQYLLWTLLILLHAKPRKYNWNSTALEHIINSIMR